MLLMPINEVSVDLGHARNRDAVSLLDCKRLIGRLQLDKGSDPVVPQVDAGLRIFSARIERQLSGETSRRKGWRAIASAPSSTR